MKDISDKIGEILLILDDIEELTENIIDKIQLALNDKTLSIKTKQFLYDALKDIQKLNSYNGCTNCCDKYHSTQVMF